MWPFVPKFSPTPLHAKTHAPLFFSEVLSGRLRTRPVNQEHPRSLSALPLPAGHQCPAARHRGTAPSSLLAIVLQKSRPRPAARLPAPLPLFSFPLSHEAVANQSGREVEGGKGEERGRKVKGTQRLSVPRLPQFSTALGRRGIVGSRRRPTDTGIHRGTHSRAPPVVHKAPRPSSAPQLLPPPPSPPPPSSSSKWRRRRQRRLRWLLQAAQVHAPTSP